MNLWQLHWYRYRYYAAKGNMIVDIGGGTTEIGCTGGIVCDKSVKLLVMFYQ
jgi:actin-like ATPase involved in cell morphogenesis